MKPASRAFASRFPRIHLLGASGSGTTTLGRALAQEIDLPHFDTDDFFWLPSDPPFAHKRPIPERRQGIESQVLIHPGWILSGSLCGWGDFLSPCFSLVIKLTLDPQERMARLAIREKARYGPLIEAGGPMHQTHQDFMAWARQYDQPDATVRSEQMHRIWIQNLNCPVKELNSHQAIEDLILELLENHPYKEEA